MQSWDSVFSNPYNVTFRQTDSLPSVYTRTNQKVVYGVCAHAVADRFVLRSHSGRAYERDIVPGSGKFWGPGGRKYACYVFLYSSTKILV